MTEENAIEVIEERVKQLEKDPAVRAILLDRFNRGDSIDDLKTYLTNMAIYTLYVPIEKDKTMKHIDDLKVGDIVKFDRCIGEYRGRFDNINIAMVLVNNRLYYVPYDKIEQL